MIRHACYLISNVVFYFCTEYLAGNLSLEVCFPAVNKGDVNYLEVLILQVRGFGGGGGGLVMFAIDCCEPV